MGNNLVTQIFEPGKTEDIIKVDKDNPLYLKVKKRKDDMTPWERVDFAFSRNEYGELSPEMTRIKDATLISMFVGAMIGGIGRSRIAYQDFFRQNVATSFETPLQAKRMLQDQVTVGMGSGAFRIGWRIGVFTFIYMTGVTVIACYRGKHGILDQVGGAAAAGFLYKIRDGPKAAVSGTVFGSLLGLTAGCLSFAVMKGFNMDPDMASMEYYTRLDKKMKKEVENMRKFREEHEMEDDLPGAGMAKMHNVFVASMNKEQKEQEQKTTLTDKNSDIKPQSLTEMVETGMKSIQNNSNSKSKSQS